MIMCWNRRKWTYYLNCAIPPMILLFFKFMAIFTLNIFLLWLVVLPIYLIWPEDIIRNGRQDRKKYYGTWSVIITQYIHKSVANILHDYDCVFKSTICYLGDNSGFYCNFYRCLPCALYRRQYTWFSAKMYYILSYWCMLRGLISVIYIFISYTHWSLHMFNYISTS